MLAHLLAISISITQLSAGPKSEIVRDLAPGTGFASAKSGDIATIEFIVRMPNGKEIANTVKRGLPYSFAISDAQNPFSQATLGMKELGEREILVTYPDPGIPGIAPSSTPLSVWVKLLSIRSGAAPSTGK